MKIVETDNFGGDYPNESFVNIPQLDTEPAQEIADIINDNAGGMDAMRFWKVVEDGYTLCLGFEP